ncbi:MAG: PAS domain S-box protein [Deltaproteobacteria bacterium]|nr:PAS domain S-box protein [Deltaproteobacteria bacterium]
MSVGGHARHTVFVVDDDPRVRECIRRILAADGHDVRVAADAAHAFALLEEQAPCMMLVDVSMSGISGFEVCRRIKSDRRTAHVPVALVTGRTEREDIEEGIAAGASDYIKKPVDPDELRLRVHAQLRLHEALIDQARTHAHLTLISAAARDAIILIDQEGLVSHWNEAAETIFGYSRQEAIGRELHDLVTPARQHGTVRQRLHTFQGTGEGNAVGKTVELVARNKAGDELPVELSLSAIRADGAWWALGIVRDIRARKRVEEEVARLSEQKQQLLNSAAEGILGLDPDGNHTFVNPAAAALLGYRPEELVGRQSHSIWHHTRPDGSPYPREECPIYAVFRDQVVHRSSTDVFWRKDGTSFPVEYSSMPICERGKLAGAVVTFSDITERRRMENALRESEEQFRMLFESSQDALMTLEPPSWRFTGANPATLSMFGATSIEDFVGRGPWELSPQLQPGGRPSAEAAAEMIGAAMRNGTATFDWTLKRLDGKAFPAIVVLTRVEHRGRRFLFATVRDITDRQRIEAELGHARKLEAVGRLAAGIAHEINTPAQYVGDSINFLAETFASTKGLLSEYRKAVAALPTSPECQKIARDLQVAEETADIAYIEENAPGAFARATDGVTRISTIVRAMKEFAHPDRREKSPADLNQALQNTLTIARNEYKYVAEAETDLGELPPVLCHVGDLNQVFLNLMVNAAHAISEVVGKSGDKGKIRIKTRHEGDSVRIDVQDTGAGIPETIRHRIFEPFFTTKEVGKGTGQGLTIARSIVVDKHGGTVTFESVTGKGSTFTIRLPIAGNSAPPKGIGS